MKYLVLWKAQEESWASLETESAVIRAIDMSDCTDCKIEVYRVEYGKAPVKLSILDCWHDPKDPLHIVLIDPENGRIEFDGYGTDH